MRSADDINPIGEQNVSSNSSMKSFDDNTTFERRQKQPVHVDMNVYSFPPTHGSEGFFFI